MTDRISGFVADGRNPDGTFAPGNPGRPKGTRLRATRAAEQLLEGETEELTRRAVEVALQGDVAALRLCLERVLPSKKDTPVQFDLPNMESAQDAAQAASAILQAVAVGNLTPLEATSVMALVDSYRRTLEVTEFEARIAALEASNEHQ